MFKPKRHHGSLKKVEKEDGHDTGITIDISRLQLEQQLRAETKKGISTKDLMKPSANEVDVSIRRVGNDDEDTSALEKVDKVVTADQDQEEIGKLEEFLKDDSAIYVPEGITIPDLAPKPEAPENDKREVETVEHGHKETIEELLELKRKMTKELKRERREEFEAKFSSVCYNHFKSVFASSLEAFEHQLLLFFRSNPAYLPLFASLHHIGSPVLPPAAGLSVWCSSHQAVFSVSVVVCFDLLTASQPPLEQAAPQEPSHPQAAVPLVL